MEQYRTRYNYFVNHAGIQKIPHQENGVMWCIESELAEQSEQTIRGGIIADEMGCGKTYMTIGLIVCNFVPATLIVLPLSLMNQWKQSIFESTGHIPFVYYGHTMKKANVQNILASSPIVLTTYGVVSYDLNNPIHSIKWDRIIFDEAHHMRNPSTQNYCAGISLKSDIKWLITGTPIQNKMNDLYALCNICGIKRPDKLPLDKLKLHILRRTKSEVGIHLPALYIHEKIISWANENEKRMANILHKYTNSHVYKHVSKVSPGKKCSDLSDEKSNNINNINNVNNNRDECMDDYSPINPKRIIVQSDDKTQYRNDSVDDCMCIYESKTEIDIKLENYVQKILGNHWLTYYFRSQQMCICPMLLNKLVNDSSKCELSDKTIVKNSLFNMNKINELVMSIKTRKDNGNKKIVFCSFRQEMDTIQTLLKRQHVHNVVVYDGRLSKKNRASILSSEPTVLLMQIKMGCEGLNLQYANEIYFVGPLWNPAMEDQAIGRCYRLGQKKVTHVFKFTMENIDYDMDRYDGTNKTHYQMDNSIIHSMDNYIKRAVEFKRLLYI